MKLIDFLYSIGGIIVGFGVIGVLLGASLIQKSLAKKELSGLGIFLVIIGFVIMTIAILSLIAHLKVFN